MQKVTISTDKKLIIPVNSNASALLLEWFEIRCRENRERLSLTVSRPTEQDWENPTLAVTIWLGYSSGYAIPYEDLSNAKEYINNNIFSTQELL